MVNEWLHAIGIMSISVCSRQYCLQITASFTASLYSGNENACKDNVLSYRFHFKTVIKCLFIQQNFNLNNNCLSPSLEIYNSGRSRGKCIGGDKAGKPFTWLVPSKQFASIRNVGKICMLQYNSSRTMQFCTYMYHAKGTIKISFES